MMRYDNGPPRWCQPIRADFHPRIKKVWTNPETCLTDLRIVSREPTINTPLPSKRRRRIAKGGDMATCTDGAAQIFGIRKLMDQSIPIGKQCRD